MESELNQVTSHLMAMGVKMSESSASELRTRVIESEYL